MRSAGPPAATGTRARAAPRQRVDDDLAFGFRRDSHRHDLVGEMPSVVRRGRALMAREREPVLLFAREAQFDGDFAPLRRHRHRKILIPQSVVDHRVDQRAVAEAIAEARVAQQIRRVRHRLHSAGGDDACAPALIERIARTTAMQPDAHTLFTVSAVTVFASPALKTTWRAGFWPTPAWSTSPKIACSISVGSMPARSIAPASATAPRVVAASGARPPPSRRTACGPSRGRRSWNSWLS